MCWALSDCFFFSLYTFSSNDKWFMNHLQFYRTEEIHSVLSLGNFALSGLHDDGRSDWRRASINSLLSASYCGFEFCIWFCFIYICMQIIYHHVSCIIHLVNLFIPISLIHSQWFSFAQHCECKCSFPSKS